VTSRKKKGWKKPNPGMTKKGYCRERFGGGGKLEGGAQGISVFRIIAIIRGGGHSGGFVWRDGKGISLQVEKKSSIQKDGGGDNRTLGTAPRSGIP